MFAVTDIEFKIERIGEGEKEAVYSFLKESFFGHEPLTASRNDVPPIEDLTSIQVGIPQGYSLKAVDGEGNMVAVCMNLDWNNRDPEVNTSDEKMKKLFAFFEYCEEKAGISELKDHLTLQILSVHPKWRNRGLGGRLIDSTVELAKEEGFTGLHAICTSSFTAEAVRRRQWECKLREKYEDYKNAKAGGLPFETPKPPHTEYCVYVKHLT
ncbi:hypothetical protein AAG570_012035 [Ranatra chinensis]|uniref:aralkylamine N-acetyltransferase n=1 Tax=Ranatra chinensis TaxID=642074 RepID=A0ABD0YI16_9HEMI